MVGGSIPAESAATTPVLGESPPPRAPAFERTNGGGDGGGGGMVPSRSTWLTWRTSTSLPHHGPPSASPLAAGLSI